MVARTQLSVTSYVHWLSGCFTSFFDKPFFSLSSCVFVEGIEIVQRGEVLMVQQPALGLDLSRCPHTIMSDQQFGILCGDVLCINDQRDAQFL